MDYWDPMDVACILKTKGAEMMHGGEMRGAQSDPRCLGNGNFVKEKGQSNQDFVIIRTLPTEPEDLLDSRARSVINQLCDHLHISKMVVMGEDDGNLYQSLRSLIK